MVFRVDLRQAVQGAEQGGAAGEGRERIDERGGTRAVENACQEILQPVFVELIRRKPARLFLALARGLHGVSLHPFDESLAPMPPGGQAPSSA